jgi:hypothetical protein
MQYDGPGEGAVVGAGSPVAGGVAAGDPAPVLVGDGRAGAAVTAGSLVPSARFPPATLSVPSAVAFSEDRPGGEVKAELPGPIGTGLVLNGADEAGGSGPFGHFSLTANSCNWWSLPSRS